MSSVGDLTQCSDQSLAYAIFTLTFDVNIGFHGFVRPIDGLNWVHRRSSSEAIPSDVFFHLPSIRPFGHTVPL